MKVEQTIGTPKSASQGINENGRPGLELMSEAGKKLAAKTAPTSLSKTVGKIPTSGVDRIMRGGR
jgi:hypothetical protein